MKSVKRVTWLLSLGLSLSLLAGCASAPSTSGTDAPRANASVNVDPYESFNRKMFAFNQGLDTYVVLPATKAYRWAVPELGREGVSNVFHNLKEPSNTLNHALQGNVNGAIATSFRFLVNGVFGLGGLFDVASWIGNDAQDEDFGQTLASWGVPEGPYLVLPLLGPSTARDVWQWPITVATNPTTYLLAKEPFWAQAGVTGLSVIDVRSHLIDSGADAMLKNVLDEYVAVRNGYLQYRQHLIHPELNAGGGASGAATSPSSSAGLLPLDLSDDD